MLLFIETLLSSCRPHAVQRAAYLCRGLKNNNRINLKYELLCSLCMLFIIVSIVIKRKSHRHNNEKNLIETHSITVSQPSISYEDVD